MNNNKGKVYYNENNKFLVKWLESLIEHKHIPDGYVDNRSIVDVKPKDLQGFSQCHFFAGIGGWSLALKLIDWPEEKQVWTGSCPCQPFSVAGNKKGFSDERHLWPYFFELIRECRPTIVFGEQVSSHLGLLWLDSVFTDLESAEYATAAANLCAAGVGAPHIRQRLYWVADSKCHRQQEQGEVGRPSNSKESKVKKTNRTVDVSNFNNWSLTEWVKCHDGKQRPVEPGIHPLANGVSARMEQLRAYGNAIVPQVAAMFIQASTYDD